MKRKRLSATLIAVLMIVCMVFVSCDNKDAKTNDASVSSVQSESAPASQGGASAETGDSSSQGSESAQIGDSASAETGDSSSAQTSDSSTVTPAAHVHEFDYPQYNGEDDYFAMVKCNAVSCKATSRRESERTFEESFSYTFDEEKREEIENDIKVLENVLDPESSDYVGAYDEVLHAYVNPSELYDENRLFEKTYYKPFEDDVTYVITQYEVAYVYYCIFDGDKEWKAKYETISDYKTDIIAVYYTLFGKVHGTKYREYFFSAEDGWTKDDIDQALTMSEVYGNNEMIALNNRIDEIGVEFRDLSDSVVQDNKGSFKLVVPNLYSEFVEKNNQLAALAGYDNYVEYAYENVYGRDYTLSDARELRRYAKKYMKNVYKTIYEEYDKTYSTAISDKEERQLYNSLNNASIFKDKTATDYVGGYLKEMNITGAKKDLDYYYKANEMFKRGNYFVGDYDGAYSYWIDAEKTSAVYFGPSSYSGVFTFVHEFGHYCNSEYNQDADMSYDLLETHSQGNEMLFLTYLYKMIGEDHPKVFKKIESDQLFNMCAISLIALAVDEFEEAVYLNTYTGEKYEDGITPDEYDDLFQTILNAYGIGDLNPLYWRYVVIESPCYYISYASSAIASLSIYAAAMKEVKKTGDFAQTRGKYYKLLTFTDDEANAYLDNSGRLVIKASYAETLAYAGLSSPFEEKCYRTLSSYFGNSSSTPIS